MITRASERIHRIPDQYGLKSFHTSTGGSSFPEMWQSRTIYDEPENISRRVEKLPLGMRVNYHPAIPDAAVTVLNHVIVETAILRNVPMIANPLHPARVSELVDSLTLPLRPAPFGLINPRALVHNLNINAPEKNPKKDS